MQFSISSQQNQCRVCAAVRNSSLVSCEEILNWVALCSYLSRTFSLQDWSLAKITSGILLVRYMATADPKRLYSWWWDSHISPKNSKWLQENLTDMDTKVKQMIKLIEEDADSFARRAEMFYKKRPELMKLVEEFYRTYRALAERYDHATGVIHQANRTIAEVFPNQVPFVLSDETPSGLTEDANPRTPEIPNSMHSMRAFFDSDEIQKDVLGLSSHFHAIKRSGALTEESVSVASRKGLKQLNDLFGYGEGIVHGKSVEGKVRKGLNFHDMEDKDHSFQKNGASSESDRVGKAETEILKLKEALAKLEAEKEAGLLQCQLSLERLSNVESGVSHAQEDSQGLKDRASKAEAEVQNMKEVLIKLETEREASLFQYQQCLEKMSHLENMIFATQKDSRELNERTEKAETEAEALMQDLARIRVEKEAALSQYNQCLMMISNLEEKLVQAEKEAKRISEQVENAEREVEILTEEVIKLTEEKEVAALRYQQCLETISQLEQKLASAQEEAQRLNYMIEDDTAKLKGAEDRCDILEKSNQTLQSELECYVLRVRSQDEELAEKHKELGRLWTSIQQERMQFLEAETSFWTLQHLHSQSQKELRSIVAELQDKAKLLNDMETHSRGLEDEVQKVKEENKILDEINLSSSMSVSNLKDEISNSKETIRKLEVEVELGMDHRNALQQEIYYLKEELNDLHKKHRTMLEQVESVGFNPECFGSSIKELQDECSKLKQAYEANTVEKEVLLEKLVVMDKLMDTNALLEISLADLNFELMDVRKKFLALEESYQSLREEKLVFVAENTRLMYQLQIATANLEKLAEKSNFLESSLFDANNELEGLRITSRKLEDSCLLLNNEKLGIIADRESLASQLEITRQKVEDIGNRYTELEQKLSGLEEERESALHMAEELHVSLYAKKQEHATFSQLSETRLAYMELQIRHLQEEIEHRKKEYEGEQDKALNAHLEILILQKFIQDLEGRSFSILIEHQKLLDASKMSHELISKLKHEIIDRQVEIKSLSEQNNILRMGLYLVLKALGIDENNEFPSEMEDQIFLKHVLMKLKEAQDALMRNCNENDQLVIENLVILTMLRQLELEGASIMEERDKSNREFGIQFEEFLALQGETQRLVQMNEELKLKAVEGDDKEKVFRSKLDDLQRQLLELQGVFKNLQEENHKALEEKISLNKKVLELEKDKCYLEEENIVIFGEKIFQSNLSLICNDIISKTCIRLEETNEDYNRIRLVNVDLKKKVRVLEEKLHDFQMENLHLKESTSMMENELIMAKSINHRLKYEMTDAKDLLSRKQNEIQLLNSQAVAVIGKLLTSSVCKEVLEGKILELAKSCQSLKNQNNCKDTEIELLKEKVGSLQDANVGLETQFAAYISGVISLNDYITSLKKRTLTNTISHKFDNKESEDHQVTLQAENIETHAVVPDGISDLQELQSRLRDVEHAVMEKERLMILENIHANAKLESLMKEIDLLKSGNSSSKENSRTNKLVCKNEENFGNEFSNNIKLKGHTYEISDSGNEVLTKDIMLDQESESSSFGISKRDTAGAKDHMVELWESTDHDGSIDLMVSNTQKVAAAPVDFFDVEAVKEHKSRYSYMESLVEKELGIDKLEISKRFASSRHEGNKRKILERLNSDVQKLTNLQITVLDLKRKVEVTENSKRGKGIEYDSVKEQLEEAEESITKLFEGNRKLMKRIEEGGGSISHEGISRVVLDESGSIRRRRISEQARKGSEKIGHLQLEVQKLQFQLMKLDEKRSRQRTRIAERKPSILLKDYLYGVRVRTGQKPKRATFCGCVQLPSRGG